MAENKKVARGMTEIERGRNTTVDECKQAKEDGGGVLRGERVGGVQISPPLRSEKRETRDVRQR